eukprot:714611_1
MNCIIASLRQITFPKKYRHISSRRVHTSLKPPRSEVTPDLTSEFNPHKNDGKTVSSIKSHPNERIWWRCLLRPRHEWITSPADRSQPNASGCPLCLKGHKSLAVVSPEIAKEFHTVKNFPLTSLSITGKTEQTVWWRCVKGHEYTMRVCDRTRFSRGCQMCESLAVRSPHIAKDFHPTLNAPLTPADIHNGSGKRVWWLCKHGHAYQMTVSQRTFSKSGCVYCRGRAVCPDNSLAGMSLEIAKQFH